MLRCPPASIVSGKVANLTERKNMHTSLYGIKKFVCLSVYYKLWPQLFKLWCFRLKSHFWQEKNHGSLLRNITKATSYVKMTTNAFIKLLFLLKLLMTPPLNSQGVWNLPHKFHLYLIFSTYTTLSVCSNSCPLVWKL